MPKIKKTISQFFTEYVVNSSIEKYALLLHSYYNEYEDFKMEFDEIISIFKKTRDIEHVTNYAIEKLAKLNYNDEDVCDLINYYEHVSDIGRIHVLTHSYLSKLIYWKGENGKKYKKTDLVSKEVFYELLSIQCIYASFKITTGLIINEKVKTIISDNNDKLQKYFNLVVTFLKSIWSSFNSKKTEELNLKELQTVFTTTYHIVKTYDRKIYMEYENIIEKKQNIKDYYSNKCYTLFGERMDEVEFAEEILIILEHFTTIFEIITIALDKIEREIDIEYDSHDLYWIIKKTVLEEYQYAKKDLLYINKVDICESYWQFLLN